MISLSCKFSKGEKQDEGRKQKELINYHCPRWNELPEIELYIDQVICVLQVIYLFSQKKKKIHQ